MANVVRTIPIRVAPAAANFWQNHPVVATGAFWQADPVVRPGPQVTFDDLTPKGGNPGGLLTDAQVGIGRPWEHYQAQPSGPWQNYQQQPAQAATPHLFSDAQLGLAPRPPAANVFDQIDPQTGARRPQLQHTPDGYPYYQGQVQPQDGSLSVNNAVRSAARGTLALAHILMKPMQRRMPH